MGGMITAVMCVINFLIADITYNKLVARFVRHLYTIPGTT